jgi:hypothetical protein
MQVLSALRSAVVSAAITVRSRRIIPAVGACGAIGVGAFAPALTQCAPTVAGTTDPALAACRILYQSVDGNGDAHMFNGACMFPRPQVSWDIRNGCRASLNAAWGIKYDHLVMCDLT